MTTLDEHNRFYMQLIDRAEKYKNRIGGEFNDKDKAMLLWVVEQVKIWNNQDPNRGATNA